MLQLQAQLSRLTDLTRLRRLQVTCATLRPVRPWTCVWPPPLQRQLAEILHRWQPIVNCRITEMKSENSDNRTYITARQSGPRTGGRIQPSLDQSRRRFSTQQTLPPVGMGSICRRSPFIADGSTKSKSLSCGGGQPWRAQFSRILQHGQSGSSQASSTELCTTRDMSPLSTVGPATTTSTTLRLAQQYLTTTMTLSPWRAARVNLCTHQVSNRPVCPLRVGVLSADDGSPTQWAGLAASQVSTPLRQSPPFGVGG